ncbi:Trk-like receptor tyrosine kinase [Aplysia californica]|uniref:Trk-like receptor tyrosine kinase n=1 Tax=Aplysia californica TaxID=6500 RepID=Q5IJ68_APLCA|nr:Trk-like receptor tyrosine kinase [Aplysia californica]AAW47268.1 Trk-like receptor tyrosine kinase [Aplysia californica]
MVENVTVPSLDLGRLFPFLGPTMSSDIIPMVGNRLGGREDKLPASMDTKIKQSREKSHGGDKGPLLKAKVKHRVHKNDNVMHPGHPSRLGQGAGAASGAVGAVAGDSGGGAHGGGSVVCTSIADCGPGAECVALPDKSGMRCYCVNDLNEPDPETGSCAPGITEKPRVGDPEHGVVYNPSLQDILKHSETNETSSMLRQPAHSDDVATPITHIVAPVIGSVLVCVILVVVAVLCRRRQVRKKLCSKRNGDNIVRNTDGALLLERMNNINKNPTYFSPSGASARRHAVQEVPADCLTLIEVVGEGAFGQVFRGELRSAEGGACHQVAVKVLKDGASPDAHEDFEREVEIMSAFDHDNILKLLGIVVQGVEGAPYMVFEYMEHGDLSELLRRNDPHLRSADSKTFRLNKSDLVEISVQIATGMRYLAAQRFVHRDLATRNCLVGTAPPGAGLLVKISDFGMSRDIYTNDYYKIGGSRMLPIRWMSPEAIKYGRFTCESDVWAYGVVLWEIFSYGRQPYFGHSNEEVIHFLDQGILLQRPEDCPSTVYHVMLGCWKGDPRQRIVFDRLLKYLTDYRDRLNKPTHCQQMPMSRPVADCAQLGDSPSVSPRTDATCKGEITRVSIADVSCEAGDDVTFVVDMNGVEKKLTSYREQKHCGAPNSEWNSGTLNEPRSKSAAAKSCAGSSLVATPPMKEHKFPGSSKGSSGRSRVPLEPTVLSRQGSHGRIEANRNMIPYTEAMTFHLRRSSSACYLKHITDSALNEPRVSCSFSWSNINRSRDIASSMIGSSSPSSHEGNKPATFRILKASTKCTGRSGRGRKVKGSPSRFADRLPSFSRLDDAIGAGLPTPVRESAPLNEYSIPKSSHSLL